MILTRLLFKLILLTAVMSFGNLYSQESIKLNQLGFFTYGKKVAVVKLPDASKFQITSPDLTTIYYEGNLSAKNYWKSSGETVQIADFSNFNKPGKYVVLISGKGNSYTFTIGDEILTPLTKGAIKAFYYNRASTPLLATHAGTWARAAGHPDNVVVVHASAADALRPAGTVISTPRGWYDAGDYNKYIVNSGISTYTLLAAYEQYPKYFDTIKLNIPESENALPDLVDEILWNVRWMLTMQDPNDGGVYNKTTNANFDGMIMPDKATTTRYVVAKGTAATLDFCAVTAVMSRIAKKFKNQLPGLSDSCLIASKKAWEWALKYPNRGYSNPSASTINGKDYPAVVTGGYGDRTFSDEKTWAASELYITTREDVYYPIINVANDVYDIPGWPTVNTLGIISLARNRKFLNAGADTNLIINRYLGMVKKMRDIQRDSSPYSIPEISYYWGSNSVMANVGILLLGAFDITKDRSYYDAALSALDYLLGRNGVSTSFVTGFGTKSTIKPHHRPSVADGIVPPVPGWLAGGPQNQGGDACAKRTFSAITYNDLDNCYATNEIAINWNAPLVFLAAGVDAGKPIEGLTGIDNQDNLLSPSLIVSPNPSSHNFVCLFSSFLQGKVEISIIDINGKHKSNMKEYIANEEFEINEYLAPGVYILKAKFQDKIITKKIVKIE